MSEKSDTKPKPTYIQDPLFDVTMRQFQKGEWTEGLENIARLLNRYPSDKDLTALSKEMTVRSRIDIYEKQEDQRKILMTILRYVLTSALVVVVGYGMYWSVREYSGFVQMQIEEVRAAAEANSKQLETFARFRDAQNLLLADRPTDALRKFNEIKEIDPSYPNLELYIDQAESMAVIENEYNRAVALLEDYKYAEALEIFTRINSTISNYRDVSIKIDQLNKFSELEVLLRTANTAFEQSQWEQAIADYTALRSKDSTFQTAFVELRLYESYLNAVQAILDAPNTSLDTLRTADIYFTKALTIFPRDDNSAEVRARLRKSLDQALFIIYVDEANLKLSSSTGSLLELSAANALLRSALRLRPEDQTLLVVYQANDRYLKTMDEFVRGDWDLTILNMEAILAEDANYASGVGAQALFDALMERGRQSLALNDYETALPYFLRALEVAEVLPNNALVLLVAQTGYAHTLGMLDRSLEAVQAYQKGVNQAGIVELARKRSASMYDLLTNAQALADIGNYPGALIAYKDAFDKIGDLLDTVSTTTQDGDYLPYLARQHGSTTDLIMQFSALLSRRIGNGDMLTIPFLPTETIR